MKDCLKDTEEIYKYYDIMANKLFCSTGGNCLHISWSANVLNNIREFCCEQIYIVIQVVIN